MGFPKVMRVGTGNKKFFLYGLKMIRTPGQQQKKWCPRGCPGGDGDRTIWPAHYAVVLCRTSDVILCLSVRRCFLALCTENVERLMPRPLSNIASLNIFDSAFHFVTSRAARGAATFHFQFDSAIQRSICEGKYQGKYRVAVPCSWTLERLDWVEVVFDLKNELAPPEISVYSEVPFSGFSGPFLAPFWPFFRVFRQHFDPFSGS